MSRLFFFIGILVLPHFVILSATAQRSLQFRQIDQKVGFNSNFNSYLKLDKKNQIWVGSNDGLIFFNGIGSKEYKPMKDGVPLSPNISSPIFEDSRGQLWFSSETALHCLPPNQDSIRSWALNSNKDPYHYLFHMEKDSILWLIVNDSLYTLNILEEEVKLSSALGYFPTFLAQAWIGTDDEVKGIVRPIFDSGQGIEVSYIKDRSILSRDSFLNSEDPKLKAKIGYLYIENDTSFWMPSSKGLVALNPKRPQDFKVYTHDTLRKKLDYWTIENWREDYLWIGTREDGLLLFDKYERRFISQDTLFLFGEEIKTLKTIDQIFVDSLENLWISNFSSGLIHTNLKQNKFGHLLPLSFIDNNKFTNVVSFVKHEDESFYILIEGSGIYHLKRKSNGSYLVDYVEIEDCPGNSINYLIQDCSKDYWIVAEGNVYLWQPKENKLELRVQLETFIHRIIELSCQQFIACTTFSTFTFNKDEVKLVNKAGLQPIVTDTKYSSGVFFAPKTQLGFLAHNNQLRVFDPENNFQEKLPIITGIGSVNSTFPNQSTDEMWVATSTGLYAYDPKTHKVSQVKSPRCNLEQAFLNVVEDLGGNLWLSTFSELFQYNPKSGKGYCYNLNDGLINNQFERSMSYIDETGKIYFAGNKGITVVNPAEVKQNDNLATVLLEEILINNEAYAPEAVSNLQKRLRLPSKKNNFKLKFTILEYSAPEESQLALHLIRNKKDTTFRGNQKDVDLFNLRPGSYRLDVYAANGDQLWTPSPTRFYFKIDRPWYYSKLAIIAYVFFGLLGVWGIIRIQAKRIKKREKRKREVLEIQAKEASFKQQVAETRNAILRLQMNPHFISNSMNAIQGYIQEKDIDTASQYLNRFAQLMRTVLHQAKEPFSDVESEIELLQAYLDTEQMRLSDQLQYQFVLDSDREEDDILIPTMILQPFVENAIWHGIAPKKGSGTITIRFSTSENQLICEVEDDGVGRAFQKNKSQFGKSHKSASIKITRDRLKLLQEKYQQDTNLDIIDLYDEQDRPQGTLVRLHLPLID